MSSRCVVSWCLAFAALGWAVVARAEEKRTGRSAAPGASRQAGLAPASPANRDIRLTRDFLDELTAYKKGFQLPAWAAPGRARQIRLDGGPMFAACQIESGWDYLTKPDTPGYVGIIRSLWTLPNLYTDQLDRRLDEIRTAGYNWVWVS